MDCFSRALLPPLHSSSMGIPANNCSYQKKKSQQALRLQDMNICTVNPAPRATLVRPGKRHLTCLPRKTTPLQTNTDKNLPCTPKDQLFTEIKQQILLRNELILRKTQVSPGLFRTSFWPQKSLDFTPCPSCREAV